MIIDTPDASRIPALRALWKQAFGDSDAFLDCFFESGYAGARCRSLTLDGQLAAALYWFDCGWESKRLAYVYAVATDEVHRGRGLCGALMEDTHRHLQNAGYAGAVLVPGSRNLFRLYEKLGYRTFCAVTEFTCRAGEDVVSLRAIDPAQYAAQRQKLLPAGSVLQEAETLAFLSRYADFYAGDHILLAATLENGKLTAHELLGDTAAAPGILTGLGVKEGSFRTPGTDKPFAMFYPLTEDTQVPAYFGLALD